MRRFHDQPLLSPSDLNDLLECRHLMALKLAAFEKRPGPRPTHGAHTEILVRYGEQHEQAILERFVAEGRAVERIETGRSEAELEAAVAQTLDAMRRGVEVIHQAALVGEGIGGYADFLERVERRSELGDWSYEVSDAKLARITKTYFLVQLSAYAGVLDRLQGHPPEQLAVLLGSGERDQIGPRTSPHTCGPFAAAPTRRSPMVWRTPTPCPAATAVSAATAAPARRDASRTTTCRWWPAFAATMSRGCRQPALRP